MLDWAGSDLLACLEEKLDPSRGVPEAIVQHALYAVANVLTGSDAHKVGGQQTPCHTPRTGLECELA